MIKFIVKNNAEVWKTDGRVSTLWSIANSSRRAYLLSMYANKYVEFYGDDDE